MRRSVLAVGTFLLLLTPSVVAWSAGATETPSGPGPRGHSWTPPPALPWSLQGGHPLAGPDASDVADAVAEGTPLALAVRQVQAHQAVRAQASEDGDGPRTTRDLLPLGDSDGDGHADVLEAVYVQSDDRVDVTLRAVSGRDADVLWTIEIQEDEFVYLAGDADQDGVHDLVRVRVGEGSSRQGGTLLEPEWTFTFDESSQLLSGADAEVWLTHDTSTHVTSRGSGGGALVAYAQASSSEWRFGVLAADPGVPGALHVGVDVRTDDMFAYASAPFAFVVLEDSTYGVAYELSALTLDGAARWSASLGWPEAYAFFTDYSDHTGDGVPDYLVTGVPARLQYLYAYAVATGVVLPLGDEEVVVRGLLLDGADGTVRWEYESPPFVGDGFLVAGGDPHGSGSEVLAVLVEVRPGPLPGLYEGIDTRVVRLDSATGEALGEQLFSDEVVLPALFADVDDDGRTEYGLLRLTLGGGMVEGFTAESFVWGVARADMSFIWTVPAIEESYPMFDLLAPSLAPDLDGDGIPDLAVGYFDRAGEPMVVLGGRDGTQLWSLDTDDETLVGLSIVDDVDGDGGHDLVRITFPEGPGDDWAQGPAHAELLRGSDLELMWRRTVFVPDNSTTAAGVYGWAASSDDIDRDGVGDLLINVDGSTSEGGDALDIALAASGVDARRLLQPPGSNGPDGQDEVELGEAAAAPGSDNRRTTLPGVGHLAVAAALGAAAWAHRRRS